MATYSSGCSGRGGFGYSGNYALKVDIWDELYSDSSSTNKSKVHYKAWITRWDGGRFEAKHYIYFSVDGGEKRSETLTLNSKTWTDYVIAEGTIDVWHNDQGYRDVGFYAKVEASSYGIYSVCEGTFGCNKINRTLNSWGTGVGWTNLNQINLTWWCDPARDWTQYNLNDGGWTNAGDSVASDNKSGNYTISDRYPDTEYKVSTRLRRSDSGVWCEVGTQWPRTKARSYVDNWTQIELPAPGNPASFNFYLQNPSGVGTLCYLERNNGGIDEYNCKAESLQTGAHTLTLSADAVNKLYQQHANATAYYNNDANLRSTSGMMITSMTPGNESYYNFYLVDFKLTKANCGPTAMKDFTCQEQQADIATLTGCATSKTYAKGNGLIVISGYSNIKINAPANPLTVRGGADNKSISIQGGSLLNSKNATSALIEKATTNNFSVRATDTRDFDYTLNSTGVTLKTYSPVSVNSIAINRENGVGKTCLLTLDGTYNNVNFGAKTNTIKKVKMLVKEKKLDWSAETVTGNTNGILTVGKINEFNITSILTVSSGKITCSNKKILVSGGTGEPIQFVLGVEYEVKLIIADELTNLSSYADQAYSIITPISSGKVLFSAVKGEGVCFGGFYDSATGGVLQTDGISNLKGNLNVTGNGYFSNGVRPISDDSNNCIYDGNLRVKRANSIIAPNNGIIFEYGLSEGWGGQLYFADNSDGGVWVNGWSEGEKGSKWMRLSQVGTVLYDNFSGSTGSITLSEPAGNFDALRIYFRDTSGSSNWSKSSVDIIWPNDSSAALTILTPDESSANKWRWSTKVVYINGTSIGNKYWLAGYTTNSTISYYGANEITIQKVVGYYLTK